MQIKNDSQVVVLTGEIYKSSIDGIDKTALPKLHLNDEKMSPFSFNLANNEIVSLLNFHVVAQGVEQKQQVTLLSVDDSIENIDFYDEISLYKIVS